MANFIAYQGWTLRNGDGQPVERHSLIRSQSGETWRIKGGTPPHHSGSTGRVSVDKGDTKPPTTREFYPSVFGLTWHAPEATTDA